MAIERNDEGKILDAARKDVARKDLLEMFGALRRAINQQDRCGCSDNVNHADECFLRNARCPLARECEQQSGKQRECKRIAIGRSALRGMAKHERHRCTERRDLRQREIDKDDAAPENLDAEIDMDTNEAHGHQKSRPEKQECFGHRVAAADDQRFHIGVEHRNVIVRTRQRADRGSLKSPLTRPPEPLQRPRRARAHAARGSRCERHAPSL